MVCPWPKSLRWQVYCWCEDRTLEGKPNIIHWQHKERETTSELGVLFFRTSRKYSVCRVKKKEKRTYGVVRCFCWWWQWSRSKVLDNVLAKQTTLRQMGPLFKEPLANKWGFFRQSRVDLCIKDSIYKFQTKNYYPLCSLRWCWVAHSRQELTIVLLSANGLDHLHSPALCWQLLGEDLGWLRPIVQEESLQAMNIVIPPKIWTRKQAMDKRGDLAKSGKMVKRKTFQETAAALWESERPVKIKFFCRKFKVKSQSSSLKLNPKVQV